MSKVQRIYLDNAATSWPKPPAVYEAVDHYLREVGGPNGRSGYREALEANRIIERARDGVARLLGARNAKQVVFGFNGTDVLNLAIFGIVQAGDHIVTTVCDHNSVLRPLMELRDSLGVDVSYVNCDGQGFVSPEDVRAALRTNTRLVAIVHASNVTGAIQPIVEIGQVVREHAPDRALYLVDAAQSLGHVPINVEEFDVDLLAAPGHKGLLGPLGTGVLYIRPGVESELRPLRFGGTGTQSEVDRQPDELPEKYESGNHNVAGLAGLAASVEFLHGETIEEIETHHRRLTVRLLEGLDDIEGVTIHGPRLAGERTSVASFTVSGYEPQELAAILEASHGIQCRAGLHCAPRMHDALGTTAGGGTLRISPGFATSVGEIDTVVTSLQEVASVALK
jgi:cysteine desulfurase / selenocysteine lyase